MSKRILSAILMISMLFLSACGTAGVSSTVNEQGSGAGASKEEVVSAATQQPSVQENLQTEATGSEPAAAVPETATDTEGISDEDAKRIAFEDAGVSEADVAKIRVRLDYEENEYEVEFYVGMLEYDYDISAKDGKIRSKDTDIEDDFLSSSEEIPGEVTITEEEAINIMLEKVPGASAEDVRMVMDRDDRGKLVFEGTLIFEGKEYDIEIDAETGAVLEWESESVFD